MEGCGNDYVYVDGRTDRPADPAEAARKVSDRHFGVGSDGLILINPSSRADFEMEMYNADGSRGMMCGNGIRCVGKYVFDRGMVRGTEGTVDTPAGIKTLKIHPGADGLAEAVTVDMGKPSFLPESLPVLLTGESIIRVPHDFACGRYEITCVSMGNPHCVIFCDGDVAGLDLEKTGPFFENDPVFPERVNTEFVNVLGRDHLRMRVWERGSGETLACGTGACAVLCAAAAAGLSGRKATVSLLGGDLEIEWDQESGSVIMTGPAREVYKGEINV